MEKPYVLGVDVGGTNTVFGVVDARGNLVISSSIKTGAHNDLNDYIKDLTAGINQLIEQVGGKEKIKGIGVGAPNGNYYTGSIEFAPNLPWKQTQIPFAQMLTDSLGIPTTLTNDANAAAIGEMTYGSSSWHEGLHRYHARYGGRKRHSSQWQLGVRTRWICR
ncbi:glucokinase-like protein [Porphyromonas gingivalis W50]|nr:glucokinase-like protein [Porphyromonas gingivalis W50]